MHQETIVMLKEIVDKICECVCYEILELDNNTQNVKKTCEYDNDNIKIVILVH